MTEFPINAEVKEDYPQKQQSLQGVETKYYESAEEVNKRNRALEEVGSAVSALSSNYLYSIPRGGNTPNNEPAPIQDGIYPVVEAGIFSLFGNTNIPSLDGKKIEISVESNQTIFRVVESSISLSVDGEIEESNTTEAVTGSKIYTYTKEEVAKSNVLASNMIVNGSFEDGSSSWNTQRWNSSNYSSGYFEGVSSGVGSLSYIRQFPEFSIGHKYYVSLRTMPSKDTTFQATLSNFSLNKSVDANVWNMISCIIEPASSNNEIRFSYIDTVVGDIYKYDDLLIIDLTDVFGAGKELGQKDMDLLISKYPNRWFDGEDILIQTKDISTLISNNRPNHFNATNKEPLITGYHNYQSARMSVPTELRVKGLVVSYEYAANKWADEQFIGEHITTWSNGSSWISDKKKQLLNNNLITHGLTKVGSEIDISPFLTGLYDNDFYIEFVTKIDPTTPDLTTLLSSGVSKTYIRYRFGNKLDFGIYDDTNTRVSTFGVITNEDIAHVVLIGEGNVLTAYLNGVQFHSYTSANPFQPNSIFELLPATDLALFRVGKTSDIDPLERFNNGNPLGYTSTNSSFEILSNGFKQDYLLDSVSQTFIEFSDNFSETLEDSLFPLEITGSNPPTSIPQFIRQKYFDYVNNSEYVAVGNKFATDWLQITTSRENNQKQNALVSGVNLSTVNGESLLTGNDIVIGDGTVSVSSKVFENVIAYGATGNGVTDDTEAIELAIEASFLSGNAVYFPKGLFLIRRGLILKTGIEIKAARGAVLFKNQAITQLLQEDVVVGQTYAVVQDASLYEIGQECAILRDEVASNVGGHTTPSFGVIDAINTVTNRIDFTPREGYIGTVSATPTGVRSYFTTDFSMITTNNTIYTENNVVDGLTINKNSTLLDPIYYFFATIHTNPNSSRTTVKNCTILGSNSDGISFQGDSEMIYQNNIVSDVANSSIHFGTSCTRILIDNNTILRAGNRGVFWCFNNHKITVTNNHFVDCNISCAALDSQDGLGDRDSSISFNTFDNCTTYGIELTGGFYNNIHSNFFINYSGNSIPIYSRFGKNLIISNNQFHKFNPLFDSNVIHLDKTDFSNIEGNIIENDTDLNSNIFIDNSSGSSSKLIITNNNIKGGLKGISLNHLINSIVYNNIIEVSDGLTAIENVNPTNVVVSNNIQIN